MPSRDTTERCTDTLRQIWMIEPVPGWAPSGRHLGRLALGSKHHLADPALAARLLGASAEGLLAGAPGRPPGLPGRALLGALFESLMTQSIQVYAQAAEGRVHHLRTRNGDHEIDLIVERDDGRVLALEVKLGRSIDEADARHLRWLRDRIGDDLLDAVLVTTGPTAYRSADRIAIVPAALLGP